MGDAESCCSRAADFVPRQTRNHQRQKIEVYNEVLCRLKDTNNEDAASPGFDDELWAHFQRLPTRYARDVNPERAEDVLLHKRLLEMAHDQATRPAIEVRLVQLPAMEGNGGRQSMNPPPAFGSFPDYELVYDKDFTSVASPLHPQLMHEITISTTEKPKLLSQLTSILLEIGLNVEEAHAFSTVDGYSLVSFIVENWAAEETDELRRLLVKEIPKAEVYNEVLCRLKDTNNGDAASPGFDEELWAHFQRLPTRYALDVNTKRAEDVLLHKRLLEMAHDHPTRPAIEVRLVQLPAMGGNGGRQSMNPPPAFGLFPDYELVYDKDSTLVASPLHPQLMHEITISTGEKPKLLSQLTSILLEIGLSVEEAHAFSTVDGYSLVSFIVENWAAEETDELRRLLVKEFQKVKIYNEVLFRVKDTNNGDTASPVFEDGLWAHFQRLPTRYALDVNSERAEDVLLHKRLLEMAHDPATRPAIEVRLVQLPAMEGNGGDSRSRAQLFSSMNPPPAFGSFSDYELVYDKDSNLVATPHYPQLVHEITISTSDKPKLLSQLSSILSEIGLNIEEVHTFSTVDGYSLNLFIVDNWAAEETDELRHLLVKEIPKIEKHTCSRARAVYPVAEKVQAGNGHISNHINVPADRLDVWEIDMNMLKYENKIASGSHGDLYKGTFCSQYVAIKVLRTDQVNEKLRREFAQEVFIMRKVRHKNVVQFIGARTRPPCLCIVTEFMSGGSMYDYIHKQKRSFDLQSLIRVAIDVSKGMNYLHQNSIIHRDLKAANLLMDENEVVKVADFGVARVQDQSGVMTAETGTYRWMAPEVIEHKPYDHKADVFSFGIALWELLTAKLPYEHLTPLQAAVGVVQQGLRPSIPQDTHHQLVDLLEKCWQRDPLLRPDFSEILQLLQQLAATVDEEREERHKFRRTVTAARRVKH